MQLINSGIINYYFLIQNKSPFKHHQTSYQHINVLRNSGSSDHQNNSGNQFLTKSMGIFSVISKILHRI